MKNLINYFLIINCLILSICFCSCSQIKDFDKNEIDAAKNIIEKYFLFIDNKDMEALKEVITDNDPPISLNNIESIKCLNIIYVSDENSKKRREAMAENYNDLYKTDIFKVENIIEFKVEFDIKLNEHITMPSGKNTWWIYLRRNDKESNWQVTNHGF